MPRTQFEIVEIERANISFDVSMVADGDIWFNATDIAKCFNKKPKDWLRVAENKKYIDVVSQRENMPFEKLVKTTRGGKYKGTWLQRINTGLIEVGMTYAERKEHLAKYYAVKLLQAA